jgi:hypothetical protein
MAWGALTGALFHKKRLSRFFLRQILGTKKAELISSAFLLQTDVTQLLPQLVCRPIQRKP